MMVQIKNQITRQKANIEESDLRELEEDGSIRSLKNGRLTEPHTPYDALNQLNKVQYPSYTEELYYDRAGNRTRHIAKGVEELYKHNPRFAKKMKEKLQHNVKSIFHILFMLE